MGVLTDIVVAAVPEAARVCAAAAPLEEWPGMDAKGIDQVKLAVLWSVLNGKAYQDELIDEFELLQERSEDGPWVYRTPAALVGLLASMDAGQIDRAAKAWLDTGEFEHASWAPQDVRSVLQELCGLARQAGSSQRDLLLWMSL